MHCDMFGNYHSDLGTGRSLYKDFRSLRLAISRYIRDTGMPMWRNGRRARLKHESRKGCGFDSHHRYQSFQIFVIYSHDQQKLEYLAECTY